MLSLFKRKRAVISEKFDLIPDPEDPRTSYVETHDGLRLIFREGKYVGWYTPTLVAPLS